MFKDAIDALKNGDPVIVYDKEGREEECDIFFSAKEVTPTDVRVMRKRGGGLICVAVHPRIAQVFDLPYLRDLLSKETNGLVRHLVRSPLPYDAKSTFSLTINHVDTYTGITDNDRATTISEFGTLCAQWWTDQVRRKEARKEFLRKFRAPGHVFLLRGSQGVLNEREGHTELSLGLALLGNLTPCMTLVEMLGDNGKALSIASARQFAKKRGIPFLKGKSIVEKYRENQST